VPSARTRAFVTHVAAEECKTHPDVGVINQYDVLHMNNATTRIRSAHNVGDAWTAADATELYEIARWGKGYFSVGGNGQVQVHPTMDASRSIDLKQLVDDLQRRGISLPTLIRFRDILAHRLQDIYQAFQAAIAQHEYSGRYVCVYPIKVNQQRQVVEEVLEFGRQYDCVGKRAGHRGAPQCPGVQHPRCVWPG
jgi:arginine decarboxylase-like protein